MPATVTCPLPYSVWDTERPVMLLSKGIKSRPTVPLYDAVHEWCQDNLNPGWKAQFINGDPCLVCDTEADLTHFQLRWGNAFGHIEGRL